eukprot:gene17356-biopygen20371
MRELQEPRVSRRTAPASFAQLVVSELALRVQGETSPHASGTRPFLLMLSCGTRPACARCRFSQ